MKIKLDADKIELVRNWFDKWVTIRSILAVAHIIIVINIWAFLTEDPDSNAFLPLLLSLMSCMVFCYYSFAGLVNKTKIIIGKEWVKVKNYPLPFPGDRTFNTRDIVEYHTRNNLNPRLIYQKVKFEIHALTDKGQQFKVLNGIACPLEAEMIRCELDKHTPATGKESAAGYGEVRHKLLVCDGF